MQMKDDILFVNRRSRARRKTDSELRDAAEVFLNWYLGAVGKKRAAELLDPSGKDGADVRRLHDAIRFQS